MASVCIVVALAVGIVVALALLRGSRRETFWIGPAGHGDVPAIHRLVFDRPDEHVRGITAEDLAESVAGGVCWIARRNETIVGACLITVPETSPESPPDPAEFGGFFVHKKCRGNGLGMFLATYAIATYFWDNGAEDKAPIPLIAHVHVMNVGKKSPRRILEALGFEQKPEPIVVPDSVKGFEHMPKNAAGEIEGHEFEYPATRRPDLFRQTAEALQKRALRAGEPVEFECPIGMGPTELLELATQLEGSPASTRRGSRPEEGRRK
jgi:GNAT superfamily N-acetyltransferase